MSTNAVTVTSKKIESSTDRCCNLEIQGLITIVGVIGVDRRRRLSSPEKCPRLQTAEKLRWTSTQGASADARSHRRRRGEQPILLSLSHYFMMGKTIQLGRVACNGSGGWLINFIVSNEVGPTSFVLPQGIFRNKLGLLCGHGANVKGWVHFECWV